MKPTAAKNRVSSTILRNYVSKTVTCLLSLLFVAAATCAWAGNVTWTGGANDGKWETGDNWDTHAMPTDADTAVFPDSDTMVTITDDVKVSLLRTAGTSSATITLTGPGSLEITSDAFAQTSWTSANFVFDVNVIATPVGSTRWISIYGNNVYEKAVDATTHKLCIRTDSVCSLTGNADVTAKYFNMSGSSAENLYLNNSLIMSGNSKLTVTGSEAITLNPGATFSISDNASLNVANAIAADPDSKISFTGGSIVTGGAVAHTNLLAANAGTYLESKIYYSGAFFPFSETVDEWVLHGGTIVDKAGNDSDGWNRIDLSGLTNATRTISGSGLLKIGQFYTKAVSNLSIRLDGPDFYTRLLSRSGYGSDIKFVVSGGSTVGAWGSNPTLEYWTTVIGGAATFDTTDGDDGATARTIKVKELSDCNGVLTVKGKGTVSLVASFTQPNLGIAGIDSSTIAISSGRAAYAVGDIVLHDSATLDSGYYMGHKDTSDCVASLTMDGDSVLKIKRYIQISGNATLSGNASAVIRNESNDKGAAFSCANLALSDNASLAVTGTVTAATLSMSGNAHLAFTAGTGFTAGAAFEGDGWTMEITIPSDYEAGIHPIVRGMEFDDDFTNHVTIVGATDGWSLMVLDGIPALYKDAPAIGLEWVGDSEDHNYYWSDSANWNNGVRPTADDKVAFGGADGLNSFDNDYLTTVSGLVFRASAGPFVITGSVDALTMTEAFPNGSRSQVKQDNATVLSLSDFDQEIAVPVQFSNDTAVLAAGGGAITLSQGITALAYKWFVVGGEVCLGGTSETDYLAFHSRYVSSTSTLRLLPGSTYTIRRQGYHSFTDEANYVGRFVIEEGATLNVVDGDCASNNGGLEYVVDGTLNVKGDKDSGRLVAGPVEQYYVGKGSIYAASARSSRYDSTSHYVNFGGELKLYMGGNWYTATYVETYQNPNYPTRFRMTDGTTLGATKDWTYGPRDNAYDVIPNTLTPADRTAIMVGTVTVDTQSPKDDAAHAITFVDPLDASAANLVKVGAGTLAFNEPAGYPSQISNLTVNAGVVQFTGEAPTVVGITANAGTVRFAAAPTLSGSLTIASTDADFCVDGVADSMAWELLATAADIVGPDNVAKWETANGMRRFKIVSDGTGKALYGAQASGFKMILR